MISQLYSKFVFYTSVLRNSYSKDFIQIIEHQKSGGTWIAKILSHYYKIPFFSEAGQWMDKRGIVRLHAKHQYSLRPLNQIYVLRDGRDVLTSYYFHLFYRMKIPQKRHFINIDRVLENFPKYLEMYFNKELGNKILWHTHMAYWIPRVQWVIRYEDMLLDSYSTLSRAIIALNENEGIDKKRLKESIEAYDFKAVAGRNRGQENKISFFRKGVSGDWRNYFNEKSAQIFDRYAGSALIRAGYEWDSSWVSNLNTQVVSAN